MYTYMYVRKEKLTAGSGEVKIDKNERGRRETLSPSRGKRRRKGGLQCFQTHSLETAFYYDSSVRAPGFVLSHKGPRKSTVNRIDISNEERRSREWTTDQFRPRHLVIFHFAYAFVLCNPILELTTATCRPRRENIDDCRDARA